jgi:hypothetical protein
MSPSVGGIVPSIALFPKFNVDKDCNELMSSGSRDLKEHEAMCSSVKLGRPVNDEKLNAKSSTLELTSKNVRVLDSNRVGKPASVIAFVDTSNISGFQHGVENEKRRRVNEY